MFLPEDCNIMRKVVTMNSKYLITVVRDGQNNDTNGLKFHTRRN